MTWYRLTYVKCCTFKHRLRDDIFNLLFIPYLYINRLNVQCSDALLCEKKEQFLYNKRIAAQSEMKTKSNGINEMKCDGNEYY